MRKFSIILIALLVIGIAGSSYAQQLNNLNEPGSFLMFPLIDNVDYTTIITIANTSDDDEILQCHTVTRPPDAGADAKGQFTLNLTGREVFWWTTSAGRTHTNVNGQISSTQALGGRIGYIFCVVLDENGFEITRNSFIGDAILFDNVRAFSYNAIPSQRLVPLNVPTGGQDRIIQLDGREYTRATSQIMFEGFTDGAFGLIDGKLAVANPGIDFILSEQQAFDIAFFCWNEDEVPIGGTPDIGYKDFEYWDLGDDLNLSRGDLGTDAFHCATTSTQAIWAVMYETAGSMAYAVNVWQHSTAGGRSTYITLPQLPSP